MSEKILCAAIWYDNGNKYEHQPRNIESGFVVCGRRHHNVIRTVSLLSGLKSKDYPNEQGFLTTGDRFVNRKEAYKIAFEQNQIIGPNRGYLENEIGLTSEDLYSEDLY